MATTDPELEEAREGREIDYTSQGWGHAIGMMRGNVWMGHGYRPGHPPSCIRVGDVLLVRMESGKVGRYEVEAIEYFRDPPDMWQATVRHAGYVEKGSVRHGR